MTFTKSRLTIHIALVLASFIGVILEFVNSSSTENNECPCKLFPRPSLWHKEETARWMVHSLDWGVLSTISTRLESVEESGEREVQAIGTTKSSSSSSPKPVPFGNIYSFVDGSCDDSTGTPYFYGTYMDQSFADSVSNNAVSFSLSEASIPSVCAASQTPLKSCTISPSGYGDPENPVCARLVLSGMLEVLTPGGDEYKQAQSALFLRHPSMAAWPSDHEWIIAKLKIDDIWLIDYFGGASILDIDAYYSVDLSPTTTENKN